MFVRTQRLTLRPGWIEDAPALARAIGQEAVVRNLSSAPWPYALGDAQSFLATRKDSPDDVFMLICEHSDGEVRLIGGIGLTDKGEDGHELGYWLIPEAWGRGYATEAGRGVVAMARESLRLRRLTSGHFLDNPASGRVLRKLGFKPSGQELRASKARGIEVPTATFELSLCEDGRGDVDPDARMAA